MPYIAVNTTQELSPALKEKLKAELGRLIALIPTKSEAGLLVDFSGGHTFFKAGKEASGAFVDLRLFHKSETEPKKKFTEETFALLSRELGIKPENMYLTITEFENWGSAGTLKS
jgi:phenylpyruvate tautomerase PptA (4-oxalocrotonate tautomerase family)